MDLNNTTISRIELKEPVVRNRLSLPPTKDHYETLNTENLKLQDKLRILSKAYYDLREDLREQEEENAFLRTDIERKKQELSQKDLLHLAYKKEQEKTINEKLSLRIKIPSVEKLGKFRDRVKQLKDKLSATQRESDSWKNKFEENEKQVMYFRDNFSRLEQESSKYITTIADLNEKLDKAETFNSRVDYEKRNQEVKLHSRIFKLNRKMEKNNKGFDKMKKEHSESLKKIEYYKQWIKRLQLGQRKSQDEMKKIQNKNFTLQTALSNEFRNSKSREKIISKMREHIRLLRQRIRMIHYEPKKRIDNSYSQENTFFRIVKDQVDKISDELNLTRRTGPVL